MIASLLNIFVLGLLFLPGIVLARRPRPLTAGIVLNILAWNLGLFLALGLLLQAFPSLIDPRIGL